MPDITWRGSTAVFFLVWYAVILLAAYSGFLAILTRFRKPPTYPLRGHDMEPVLIIRPLKGIEPEMYTCLESSFRQDYPVAKFEILFCVDDRDDPAIPVVQSLLERYPEVNAQILVSNHDSNQNSTQHFGPNPKVNNLAKGFAAAQHDILWVMDSNVWASPGVLRNSVVALNFNTNNGTAVKGSRRNKLVHHVPLVLSVSPQTPDRLDSEYVLSPAISRNGSLKGSTSQDINMPTSMAAKLSAHLAQSTTPNLSPSPFQLLPLHPYNTPAPTPPTLPSRRRPLKKFGAQLDEMFLLTSHLKFYVALNNLAIAPCVNGKSNIYRRSDLDAAVAAIPAKKSPFFSTPAVRSDALELSRSIQPGNSIKFFARYIGEDNMIGIALWENLHGRTGLTADVVIQPLSGTDNTIGDYALRRVRWLRVRKYMVLAATLVEPTTESIICGVYGTYAVLTLFFHQWFSWWYFAFHMLVWVATDYIQYYTLVHNISSFEDPPMWLSKSNLPPLKRPFRAWLQVWIMRELLALPIWISAMVGHEIDWRGRPFRIKPDLSAEEL